MIMVVLLAMELIDKIKFRDELELARDLQADLIPKSPPQTNEYEIAAFNRIANTVGGDIYDFVPLPDGRLAVLFGDASGHGMAAGLVMAVAHAAWRTQLDVDPSPGAIISSLNRILCRTGGPRSFFSCCYFLLERDGTFIATVAGHPQIVKIAGGQGHRPHRRRLVSPRREAGDEVAGAARLARPRRTAAVPFRWTDRGAQRERERVRRRVRRDDRRLEPFRLGIDTRRNADRRMEPLHRRQRRPRMTSRLR